MMTEISLPWAGQSVGDAGPYSDDDWSDVWRKLFVQDRAVQGIIRDYLDELAVSGVTSPVDVETGAAIVDGKFYENDAAATIAVPTPSVSTRVDLIVLEKDFAAQTVRITREAGTEGAGAPSIVQTDGTTWQIPLAQASITTGGVITVTDARTFVYSPLSDVYANHPIRYVSVECFSYRNDEACITGDGAGWIPDIPVELDGWVLVSGHAAHKTAGGGNANTLIQVHNVTKAQDMFSAAIRIDAGETRSEDAAAGSTVNPAQDDISAHDELRVDVDQLDNTPTPVALAVTLGFQEP